MNAKLTQALRHTLDTVASVLASVATALDHASKVVSELRICGPAHEIDYGWVYAGASQSESLQETATIKARWLKEAQRVFPLGTRVRVISSDLETYIGKVGTVRDYDIGNGGGYPLVSVLFDEPAVCEGREVDGDGFYDDTELKIAR